jgi:hypothetical protein
MENEHIRFEDADSSKKSSVQFTQEPEQIPPVSVVSPELQPSSQDDQIDGLNALSDSLNAASLHSSLQKERLAHFDYQPFSLPPTRVS